MQSFICHPPQLVPRVASKTIRCPTRRPFKLAESRPLPPTHSSTQPPTLPRGRGRPRKSPPSQPPEPRFQNPSRDEGTNSPVSSDSARTATQTAKKARGRPRKKGRKELAKEDGGATRAGRDSQISNEVTKNSARQEKKQFDVTGSKAAGKTAFRTSVQKTTVAGKGPRDKSDRKIYSNEVYKGDASSENDAALPEVVLGELEAPRNVAQGGRGKLSQAVGRQRKSNERTNTIKQTSTSPTSSIANKQSKKSNPPAPRGRKASRVKQKAVGKPQKVVNALDLELGMPDEVPLVPVSNVKAASKAEKATTAVSQMGEQRGDEYDTSLDIPDSTLADAAEQEEKLANPSVHETHDDIDLGGGLNEVEIAKIRKLASSTGSRESLVVSRAGIKLPSAARANKTTAVQTEEQKQSVHASFRRAEEMVEDGVEYDDGRYGSCFQCGEALVIPGVARFFCKNCGWLTRAAEIKSISPGHHD